MYPTSEKYKQAVRENTRNWRIRLNVVLDSGEMLALKNEDIIMGSFSYDESSICSSNLDIGATYANAIEFSLQNADNRFTEKNFSYAKIEAYVGLQIDKNTWEDIPLGVFFVTEEGKKLSTVPIKALDRMYMLNQSISKITILPNSTPYEIIVSMKEHFGFIITDPTINMLKSINLVLPVFNANITCRDFIGYCAAILGKSARFDRAGRLEFYFISDNIYETDSTIRTSLSKSDLHVQPTGVLLTDADKKEYFMGSEHYVIEIASNPLLINEEIAEQALSNAFSALTGLGYTPYTCSIIGDPSVQCGDRICHYEKDSGYTESIITNFKFNLRAASQIEAKGKPPEADRQMTESAKKIIEVREKAAKDLNDGLTGMERTILTQSNLLTSSMGFHPYTERDEDGKMIAYYLMDDPDPNVAKTVWRYGMNGMGVSRSGIHGPFTSSWTADDTIVARLVTAEMIKTGTIKALDEKIAINLDDGVLTTRTQSGTCDIKGNQIELHYNTAEGKSVSTMMMTADETVGDNTAGMKVSFISAGNTIESYIEQQFEFDKNTGLATAAKPMRIYSTEVIEVDKDLRVLDSILYDKIKMQRKNTEEGNTGVDFVYSSN